MKTIRFFAAAIALLSVLSCQKEAQENNINPDIKGGQLITCGFANNDPATKTTLDGWTPKWAVGDKIMLYDGSSNIQELTLASSGTASSTTGIIDGTDATKFSFLKPAEWEEVYAIYPSSACVSGFDSGNAKLNFAGQDGSFAKANICAAVEISSVMSFKNVGAILKFPSKPATVTDILIPVPGLAKDYTVSFPGDAPSLNSVDATNSNSFSIGSGTGDIYIGVPAGEEIANGSAFIYKDASGILGSYLTGAANTPAANKIYTLPAIEANGKLSGVFTVGTASGSYTGKVQFSKGNLYAKKVESTWTWGFYANQYQYNSYPVDTDGTRPACSTDTEIDHFCWGSQSTDPENTTYSSSTSDIQGTSEDWGVALASSLPTVTGGWKTLTSDEWTYLLNTRSGDKAPEIGAQTDARYAEVKVNGVCGMLIFPDTFTWPDGISTLKPTTFNTYQSAWNSVNYTAAEFILLESAGCVFLPAAGYRNGSNVDKVGSKGYYWPSTPYNVDRAYYFSFYSSGVYLASTAYRYYGYSVRLVCAAQ